MRRAPGFAAVVVLSLALGIGANTAIFTLINSLMLRRLPVRAPGRLVEPLKTYPGDPRLNAFSPGEYRYLREHNDVFSGIAATTQARVPVRGPGGREETLDGEWVSVNYFSVLGVGAARGRAIGPEDARSGPEAPAAVVSWSCWRDRFSSDPAIVGRKISAGSAPATIVGVMPREFQGVRGWLATQIWLSGGASGSLVARLKDGVAREQAAAQTAVLYRRAQQIERDPLEGRVRLELESAAAGVALPVLRDRFARPAIVLMAMVGLILLLACANVAGMLLARAASREREMALRVSLGAGRWRLARQAFVEALLLSAAGAAAGVTLAWLGAKLLVQIIASGRPVPGLPENFVVGIQPDAKVLAFTAAVALLAGLLFGLAPALRAMAAAPAGSLQAAGRSGETRRGRRFAAILVAGQAALAVVVVSLACQFAQHLAGLRNNLGFEREHLLLVSLRPSGSGLDSRRLAPLYRELLERLEAIPGVRSATLCGPTPVSGAGASRFVTVEGHRERLEDRRYVSLAWVAPNYFQTLGTPLLAGRDFSFQDQGGARVAIVNQTMARYYFGANNPLGKHIRIDPDPRTGGWYGADQPYEVVGVAADAKYHDPAEAPSRTLYFNAFQEDRVQSNFVLRTAAEPSRVLSAVNQAVSAVGKGVTVRRVTTMAAQVDAAIVPQRLIAMLSGAFGTLGALLAAVGLYGLLAYTVSRRTNEIGIRMALGATRAGMSRMVLGNALQLTAGGLAIGLPCAIWAKVTAAHLVEDLRPDSPLPVAAAGAVILAVAFMAAYLPARRAARVDPMEALRYD